MELNTAVVLTFGEVLRDRCRLHGGHVQPNGGEVLPLVALDAALEACDDEVK